MSKKVSAERGYNSDRQQWSDDALDVDRSAPPHWAVSNLTSRAPKALRFGLVYFILAALLAGIAASAFLPIDLAVSAQAHVAARDRIRVVNAEGNGLVEEILVVEGQHVRRGEPLVRLRSFDVSNHLRDLAEITGEYQTVAREIDESMPIERGASAARVAILDVKQHELESRQEALFEQLDRERRRFELRLQTFDLKLRRNNELVQRLKRDRRTAKESLDVQKELLEANEKLVSRSVISKIEYLQVRLEYLSAEDQLQMVEYMIRDAEHEARSLDALREEERIAHEKEIAELESNLRMMAMETETVRRQRDLESAQLKSYELALFRRQRQLEEERNIAVQVARLNLPGVGGELLNDAKTTAMFGANTSVVRAPVDGRISDILVRGQSEAVSRSQPLLYVVPGGADQMVVEAEVGQEHIADVAVGQRVKVKVDSFPYGEYGVLTGEVSLVLPVAEATTSKVVVIPEVNSEEANPSFFQVQVELDRPFFLDNGERLPLKVGMSGSAEIITTKTTFLELLTQPIRRRLENRTAQADPVYRSSAS